MDKDIGFRRNVYRAWLDAAALLCTRTDDVAEIRRELEPLVGRTVEYTENRRMAIDIVINIWVKSGEVSPHLRSDALRLFQEGGASDRLWLHYGLCLLYYAFFRDCVAAVGQIGRFEEAVTPALVKRRVAVGRGQPGAQEKAVERVLFSLREWGLLAESGRRYAYVPQRRALSTGSAALELWLLACALHAYEGEAILLPDLLRLPELFPFRFSVGLDDVRRHPYFEVSRQGIDWDLVRLSHTLVAEGADDRTVATASR